MTISVKWAFFEKCQTQDLSNCIRAYTRIQIFLANNDQDMDSDWNPDISLYRIFSYGKKALIRERCITGLKKLNLSAAAQKFGTRPWFRKPSLVTQNMVFVNVFTTKCAICQ